MLEIVAIAVLGLAAGVVAGMFGVGGGIIFVPALTLVVGLAQLEAEATSLLAIIPVAVLGTWRQRSGGEVHWTDAALLGVGAIVTAVVGALIADAVPERALQIGFAGLLLVTAAQLVVRTRRTARG